MARDSALSENEQMKAAIIKYKADYDEHSRLIKVLTKDSEQLSFERNRATQLTIDLTKANEKNDNTSTALKALKKDFSSMKFKYEMTMKVSKKTEDELDLHRVDKEKMMRDLSEL